MSRSASLKSVFATALCVLCVSLAWAAAPGVTPKYDKATETKVKGTVEEIKDIPGPLEGTHLMVKGETGTILVHVAPVKFLKEMEASFAKGDAVEVVGSKVKSAEGEDEILAKEVVMKDNNVLTLRDAKGKPVWVGWMK